jgi:parallel beta-helix repeat protein
MFHHFSVTLFSYGTAILLVAATVSAQGPMSPPPGPPGPVMKSLDQIEPRIALGPITTQGNASNLHIIREPGSYYLTGNVQGESGKVGILINASGVTLDLNGFHVIGVPGPASGIFVPSVATGCVIRNGTVRNWDFSGLDAMAVNSRFEGLVIRDNGSHGLYADTAIITDCQVSGNGAVGIIAAGYSVATRVIATQNRAGLSAQRVVDCTASDNELDGISGADIVTGSQAEGNGRDGITSCRVVRSSVSRRNEQDGIMVVSDAQVVDCIADNNSRHGIRVIASSRVHGNSCNYNGGGGFGHGIHVEGNSNELSGNTCTHNQRGMTVTGSLNRIEANHFAGNTGIGLFVTGQLNLITRNTARTAGGVNWNIAAGNRGGVFLGPAQNAAINGASGGPGSGTTDPFANLSF